MGLLSTLCYHFKNETNLINTTFGFIAYGSGSKSKVFEAIVEENWKTSIEKHFQSNNKDFENMKGR